MLVIKINTKTIREIHDFAAIVITASIVVWTASLGMSVGQATAFGPVSSSYIGNAVRNDPAAGQGQPEEVDTTEAEIVCTNGAEVEVMEIRPAGGREAATSAAGSTIRENRKVEPAGAKAVGSAFPIPPQRFKDAAAKGCSKVADNRLDLYGAYASRNEFASKCYRAVLAMAFRESSFNEKAIGDCGLSVGAWQIQTKMHGVSVEDAENVEYMSERVADFLAVNGFPLYWHRAVSRWNGSGPMAEKYADAVYSTASLYNETGI